MIALPADFHALLDHTLAVMGTEFGRTPRIIDNDGREHQDTASKCLLAGAGMGGWETRGQPQRQLRGDAKAGGSPGPGDDRPTDLQAKGLLELGLSAIRFS